jgi:alkanesulfonate monooxygenase SsuD/methylene tetrahydromethanopterin reductase-like flavin-dependent oxidoreductase (luciferase family)
MIRFHYMATSDDLSPDGLSKLSDELDSYGYYSVLLTYDPMVSDNLIKVANILNKNHKIKYMPAIRTYSMSPEYFGMVCRAFDEIQENRLMVNIISGNMNVNETYLEDIVAISSFIRSHEQRIYYTEEWVQKFLSLKFMSNYPEIVMSGHSDKTIEIANNNKIMHVASWFNYKDFNTKERYKSNYKQMVNFAAVVRDSMEEAQSFIDNLNHNNAELWTIYGTKETLYNHILELYNEGVHDVQISTFNEDTEKHKVHQLIKEMDGKING